MADPNLLWTPVVGLWCFLLNSECSMYILHKQANTHTHKIKTNASFRGKEILLELYWCHGFNESGSRGLMLSNSWSPASRTALKDQEVGPCVSWEADLRFQKSCRFSVFSVSLLSLPCGCGSRCELSPVPSLCYCGFEPSEILDQIKNFLVLITVIEK